MTTLDPPEASAHDLELVIGLDRPRDHLRLLLYFTQLIGLMERSKCADPKSLTVFPSEKTPPLAEWPEVLNGAPLEEIELQGKDNCATFALMAWQELSTRVVGWAINHLVGQAICDGETDFGVAERIGEGPAEGSRIDLDPRDARKALIEIVDFLPLPNQLRIMLGESLRALQLGETTPLLTPRPTGRRGPAYTLAKLRMKVVAHTHFRYASGWRFLKAQNDIAEKFGVPQKTLESWEQRLLPAVFGKECVRKNIQWARDAGKLIEEVRNNKPRREAILAHPLTVEYYLLLSADFFENEDIAQIGAEYRRRALKASVE